MNTHAPQLTDADLLAAFLQHRDEAPFRQLVDRHLPQVYAHARRLLHDPHRAEDAAQTVFLLLAQRAHALHALPSLAGWLYKTTHFTCANIRRIDARRKRHEQERARMQPDPAATPLQTSGETDLELHLDAILQKLPARDRELLLLRFVHDHPLLEIAKLTNTTEAAAKKRLQRAIASLRGRFATRNLHLPASFTPATLLAAKCLPAHLPAATSTAALSPTTSLLTLAKTTTTLMLATKLKLTAALLLTAILFTTTAAFILARPHAPSKLPTSSPTIAISAPATAPALPQTSADSSDTTPDPITVRGTVLDPAGKPLPNATISLPAIPGWIDKYTTHIITQTTAGPDGRFQLSFHKADLARFSDGYGGSMADAWKNATLFAAAPNLGLAWSPWNRTDPHGDLRLQLTPDDTPIRGQLLAADGQPAPNVLIGVEMLLDGSQEKVEALLAKSRDDVWGLQCSLPFLSTNHAPILTDASGHFEIHGLGHNRTAFLHVCSPTIPFARLQVVTSPIAPPPKQIPEPSGDVFTFITYPATFTYTAPPALSIEGTIRDAATHQPVPNILVESTYFAGPFQGIDPHGIAQSTSDAAGHYHLDGFPRLASKYANRLVVVPPKNQPYFLRNFSIDDLSQPTLTLDIELHKGILITGKVTDKITGQPQPARIEYTTYRKNPHTADLPEFSIARGVAIHDYDQLLGETDPDGSYHVVAVPGKAVIAVMSQSNRYLHGIGAHDIPAVTDRHVPLFNPVPVPYIANVIKEFDVPENAPPPTVDFQLDPGATARINLVDDKNQPITHCQVVGDDAADYVGWNPHIIPGSTFTAIALTPDKPRIIAVLSPARNLGIVEEFNLSDLKDGAFTLHLAPLATITGRLLDATTSAPIPNTELAADVGGRDLPTITTDAAGNFRYPLPTGQDAGIAVFSGPYAGTIVAQHLFPDPGETQPLNDIKIRPRRRPR